MIVSGIHKSIVETGARLQVAYIAFSRLRSFKKGLSALKELERKRREFMGDSSIGRVAKVGGRYYWDLHSPGWPSAAFVKYHESEVYRISPYKGGKAGLKTAIWAITTKCGLACEHCFEWNALNKPEKLSIDQLHVIQTKLLDQGIAQLQYSGGEPMNRFADLVELATAAKEKTSSIILSSGHLLNSEKVKLLKEAGIKGVCISLDHYDEDKHNQFRQNSKSYEWALNGAKAVLENEVLLGLSACVTKDWCKRRDLEAFMELAKRIGASFVQFLEPRAVGHYEAKDVELGIKESAILEEFFLRVNQSDSYRDYPIVIYHGYHQRRAGCFGAGDRYLYIDTDGDIHACPFCQNKNGSMLEKSPTQEKLEVLKSAGCQVFEEATI